MPQLDITMNVLWYIIILIVLGILYLQNVYIYFPFLIKGWKIRTYYSLYLIKNVALIYDLVSQSMKSDVYYYSSCIALKYGSISEVIGVEFSPYSLEVLDYRFNDNTYFNY